MLTTEAWAQSLGISTAPIPAPVRGSSEFTPLSASQLAVRAVLLQGVVAVAAGVEPEPVRQWLRDQGVWEQASPQEQAFLSAPSNVTRKERIAFQWRQEAEWTLLWAIGKVESIGLPTRGCDTRRLVDELIPPLGSDTGEFIASAQVRAPAELLAEDDRTYNLWCYAHLARRKGDPLPEDLMWDVLYQRRCVFEWLDGGVPWDEVTCDA